MRKKIVALMLVLSLVVSMCGCIVDETAEELLRETYGEEFAQAYRESAAQRDRDIEQVEQSAGALVQMAGEAVEDEQHKWGNDLIGYGGQFFTNLLVLAPSQRISRLGDVTERGWNQWGIKKDLYNIKTDLIVHDVPDYMIKKEEIISVREFHPFLGLTKTMIQNIDQPSDGGLKSVADALGFVTTWVGESIEITSIRVITTTDGKMIIEYGDAIETPYAGKRKSLYAMLVDKYYEVQPSIVFTAGTRADEMIRSWFGLTGEGKYSMEMKFGRVKIGDCGYRLIYENGKMYQVPILHEDTEMKVFYKEKGKDAQFVLDAADFMGTVKIELPKEEEAKVLEQLRKNGYIN